MADKYEDEILEGEVSDDDDQEENKKEPEKYCTPVSYTHLKEDFVEQMLLAIRRHKNAFSCAARMVQYHDRDKLDDAGNYYCALGWSFARGKGKNIDLYQKEEKIFSACGGAAIYRKKIMEKIGYFDEEHFAYLEDTDIGYRARIYGYENWYAPDAVVYHVGSGTSGSRYNPVSYTHLSGSSVHSKLHLSFICC